jgi:hypothetical protein
MLSFDDAGTLEIAPGATQLLAVTATPPREYAIGFSLVGDPADGSLDHALVITGGNGHATVTLQAPSSATTFHVRASLLDGEGKPTGVVAEREVSVSGKGYGSVSVVPSYLGHRTVMTWNASVSAGTCAELKLQGVLPNDPANSITASAPFQKNPLVTDAPVGPNLAVVVRAGHFAWGCTDTTMLTAGATLSVPVAVIDKPLDLADTGLTATFSYTPDPAGYASVLQEGVTTLVDAFMPTSANEGTILLNEMAAVTTDPATFAALRVQLGWDALAESHLSALPKSLRDTCSAWATAGLAMQPATVQAGLVGGPGGALTITVTQFGSLDATTAGVSTAPGATWSGQPNDSVLLSGVLLWDPSRFAGVSSLVPAQTAHPDAPTVASALAMAADCHGLAGAMGAFGTCAIDCVELLCDEAIAQRWTTALSASTAASMFGQLVIQASATASVGDVAEATMLDGHWQGKLNGASSSIAIKGGTLSATAGFTM